MGEEKRRSCSTLQGFDIPDHLNTPEFREAWTRWAAYRRDVKKKPLTAYSTVRLLSKLKKVSQQAAIAAIDKSIDEEWQGLFPDGAKTRHALSPGQTIQGRRITKRQE